MEPIRIIIIEDDKTFREGIVEMLTHTRDIEVIGAFASAEPFIHSAENYTPDIVIMDIGLPGLSGIEAIPLLRKKLPETQFLVWTVFEDDKRIFDALKSGANGYLLKHSTISELINAIKIIHSGGSTMSPTIARKVMESFHKPVSIKPKYNLSKREEEIVYLLSQGYSYKDIGDKLFISIDTVRSHIRRIYNKLQVKSKLEAINKYYDKD